MPRVQGGDGPPEPGQRTPGPFSRPLAYVLIGLWYAGLGLVLLDAGALLNRAGLMLSGIAMGGLGVLLFHGRG